MDMTTLPLPALRQCLDTMALESLFRLGATSTGYADVIAEHKPLRGDAFGLYVEVVGETYGITVAVGVSHQTSLDEGAHFLRKWYAMDGWKQGEVLLRELFSNPLFTALPNKICVSLEYVTIDAALLEQLSCLAHLSELSVHQCPLSDQMAFKSLLDELEPKCLKLKAQEVAETPMITQDFFTSPINRLEMTSPGLGDGTTAVLLALKLEHLDYEETGLFYRRWMKEFVKAWCDGKAPFEKIYVRTGLGVDEEREELLDHLQPHMHECTLHMGHQVLNVTNPMMRALTPGVFRRRRWETTLRRETDGETALLAWVEREATAGVVFYYPDPRS